MFQFASLLPMLTVKENLLLPTCFRSGGGEAGPGQREKKADDLLAMVGLTEKINAYPSQLSGGQQRRVAIARAFMNGPALILADEPTGDLDEETELDMMNFFRTMNKAEKITFIMVTHNTDLAKQTQRRLRMHRGLLQEQ
jgi:putative ABC transport system ATP-binding protein/lipoprotein-releasing system ATP-binding protein